MAGMHLLRLHAAGIYLQALIKNELAKAGWILIDAMAIMSLAGYRCGNSACGVAACIVQWLKAVLPAPSQDKPTIVVSACLA